jgi:hypothetical protein
VFIAKISSIRIEPIDLGFLKQILHPEYPKGPLSYNPQFHYNYIVAFVARLFGFEANSQGLVGGIWFLEQALTLIVLVKICDFLFKGDRLTVVLVLFMYLMLKSGETDQKTMLRPLHFFAIYYFLKEKWLLAAIFSASIFYLHIGVAIWWFVPSCFALCLVYIFKNKQVDFFQIIIYSGMVTLLASPILYYYIANVAIGQSFTSEYFINYWYGRVNNSVLYELLYSPIALTKLLIMVGVFTVGYMKWKDDGSSNDYILAIALGVLIIYALDFVLVDVLFIGTAIKMQLLRSKMIVEFFAALFFSFLIARQLKKGNYVFFVLLLILLIPNPFWKFIHSFIGTWDALILLYAFVVIYEIFEWQISAAREKINSSFGYNLVVSRLPRFTRKFHRFFQNPVNLVSFIVVVFAFQAAVMLSPLKLYVKSILGFEQLQSLGMSKNESLLKDIVEFTNEQIKGDDVILAFPFGKTDFAHYTNQNVFVHAETLLEHVPKHVDWFQRVFENDFKYSIEKLRSGGSWDEIWEGVDKDLILKWRREYGITHVIRENELPLDLSVVYENKHYTVYDLRMPNDDMDG